MSPRNFKFSQPLATRYKKIAPQKKYLWEGGAGGYISWRIRIQNQKVVRIGDQKWEMVEITIGIIFFVLDSYSLFFIYVRNFQVPPEKNYPHPKYQLPPKIAISTKYLLYKPSENGSIPPLPFITQEGGCEIWNPSGYVTGFPGLKPRFYFLLYDFFGLDWMTFYDHFMIFQHFQWPNHNHIRYNIVPQRQVFDRGGDEKYYSYSITMYNHVSKLYIIMFNFNLMQTVQSSQRSSEFTKNCRHLFFFARQSLFPFLQFL